MAGEIAYKLTAEEKQAVEAIRKVAEAYAGVEGGVKKVSEETKKLEREQAEMGRAAKKVFEDTRTPMEEHQARLQKLAELLRNKKIDEETYGRAAAESYAKMEAGLEKARAKAGETGQTLEETGHKGIKAFSGLGKEILGTVTTLTGFAGVLGTVNQVFDKMREAKQGAAQEARDAEFSVGSLKQMTGGDQKRYDGLVTAAKEIHARGGARSLDEGARVAFALESAGLLDQRETFIQLKAKSVVDDTAGLARGAKTMITSMGEDQVGSARQVISKGIAAGRWAPTYMQEILPAAARAGTAARGANVTDKELLATTALLAEATGDPGRATTQEKAMFKAVTLARAYGARETPPMYSDEEFQRDKEALDKERTQLQSEAKAMAKHDPQYLAKIHALEIEKANLPKTRKGTTPEEIADKQMRMRAISEAEQEAYREAEGRVEQSEKYHNISSTFKMREESLVTRRKAASAGIATDDEGQIIDDERQKLLAVAGRAMKNANPDMLSQLKALRGLNLDQVQMKKLFSRQEGYEAMDVVLRKETQWSNSLADITRAEREDEITKILALKDPRSQKAAQSARVEGTAEADSAEEIGIGTNVYEAAEKRYYRLVREGKARTALPAEVEIALHKVAVGTVGKLPGQKKRSLRAMYEAGEFEPQFDVPGNSGLKSQVEQELGIRDESGQLSKQMSKDATTSYEKLHELLQSSIQAQKEAAQAQKEAGEKIGMIADKFRVSTLGSRHGDPGDRY